ncbi:MAG: SprT family zinc-dependent metalloprotease [Deltaproteobacteria bacterium]|nr:SprT family zinc-dependent metalloprotease [Deltaproteobacteria bacterium]
MEISETLEIDGVGPVLFERSVKARRVNISVRPVRGVRVAVPRGVPFERAGEFLRSRLGWVKKHQRRIRAAELERAELLLVAPGGQEARRMLVGRLDALSMKLNLPYNRVFIRVQKTRWGSCSAKKNINLNMRLAALPQGLIDYVITHELVHTRVMNHGRAFWAELERLFPGAKKTDAELRKYRAVLG